MENQLRKKAMAAFGAGLKAADPAHALKKAVAKHPFPTPKQGGKRVFIAIGKAAISMMREALAEKSDVPFSAFAVTNYENAQDLSGVEVIAAGHPVPDESGLKATKRVAELAENAEIHDEVIVLISGGGSALLPAPRGGLSLTEKMQINDLLLKNNLEITDMNLVRQNLSFLKGGKLAALAAPAPVTAYILSDVIGDDLNVVASGPTANLIGNPSDAKNLLKKHGLWDQIPDSAKLILSDNKGVQLVDNKVNNILIGSNQFAAQAMAKEAGATFCPEPLEGEVSKAVATCLKRIAQEDMRKPFALAWGGETTVKVTGSGKGGRNQEFALRFAIAAEQENFEGNWCFLSGATDGRDGPTDAAGGLVDAGTLKRIQESGNELQTYLDNNDSYHALENAGDLIDIGATGTNVADLQLFIFAP